MAKYKYFKKTVWGEECPNHSLLQASEMATPLTGWHLKTRTMSKASPRHVEIMHSIQKENGKSRALKKNVFLNCLWEGLSYPWGVGMEQKEAEHPVYQAQVAPSKRFSSEFRGHLVNKETQGRDPTVTSILIVTGRWNNERTILIKWLLLKPIFQTLPKEPYGVPCGWTRAPGKIQTKTAQGAWDQPASLFSVTSCISWISFSAVMQKK